MPRNSFNQGQQTDSRAASKSGMTAMKDRLGPAAIDRLAQSLKAAWPEFPQQRFARSAKKGLETLELKQRVSHIIAAMHACLPNDFAMAATVLEQLPGHAEATQDEESLSGFAAWPAIDYSGVHGLGHPDLALPVLRRLTPLFTAEYAIRPFLAQHTDLTFSYLQRWLGNPDEHVRRLVSEGTRPRLPWGQSVATLTQHPERALPLLEVLRDDPSPYVRRSVANHLNDIAKQDPALALSVLERWFKNANPERLRLIKHAARGLIKSGDARVFRLLGYDPETPVILKELQMETPRIEMGETLTFQCTLHNKSQKKQAIVLDYALHFRKANGKTAPKVFKGSTLELAPGEQKTWRKKHTIKVISTRVYYPGSQKLEISINGRARAVQTFQLDIPA